MRLHLSFMNTILSILFLFTLASCAEWDENRRLERLAKVQDDPKNLQDFTTDGCSGYQSESWEKAAEYSSVFKKEFGSKPPWVNCCEEHDRVYWKGETENGYQKRLEADEALNACVAETGQEMSEELSKKWSKPKEWVETGFEGIGSLMYHAVRGGGMPCTDEDWRWGYGWPKCPD